MLINHTQPAIAGFDALAGRCVDAATFVWAACRVGGSGESAAGYFHLFLVSGHATGQCKPASIATKTVNEPWTVPVPSACFMLTPALRLIVTSSLPGVQYGLHHKLEEDQAAGLERSWEVRCCPLWLCCLLAVASAGKRLVDWRGIVVLRLFDGGDLGGNSCVLCLETFGGKCPAYPRCCLIKFCIK